MDIKAHNKIVTAHCSVQVKEHKCDTCDETWTCVTIGAGGRLDHINVGHTLRNPFTHKGAQFCSLLCGTYSSVPEVKAKAESLLKSVKERKALTHRPLGKLRDQRPSGEDDGTKNEG